MRPARCRWFYTKARKTRGLKPCATPAQWRVDVPGQDPTFVCCAHVAAALRVADKAVVVHFKPANPMSWSHRGVVARGWPPRST